MGTCETGRHRLPGTAIAAFLLTSAAFPALTFAAMPPGDTGGATIARAGLQPFMLNDAQLGKIRGGMTLPNGISLTFGFQQITTVNGALVLSILVPQISITTGTINLPVYVYSATTTPQVSHAIAAGPNIASGNTPVTTTTSTTNTATASFLETNDTPSGTLTNKPSGTAITVPISTPAIATVATTDSTPGGAKYNVPISAPATTVVSTSTSGAGSTSVQTAFSGNGIISGISNSLNNEIIEQTSLMNIGVTGLTQSTIATQTTNRVLNNVTQGFGIH